MLNRFTSCIVLILVSVACGSAQDDQADRKKAAGEGRLAREPLVMCHEEPESVWKTTLNFAAMEATAVDELSPVSRTCTADKSSCSLWPLAFSHPPRGSDGGSWKIDDFIFTVRDRDGAGNIIIEAYSPAKRVRGFDVEENSQFFFYNPATGLERYWLKGETYGYRRCAGRLLFEDIYLFDEMNTHKTGTPR